MPRATQARQRVSSSAAATPQPIPGSGGGFTVQQQRSPGGMLMGSPESESGSESGFTIRHGEVLRPRVPPAPLPYRPPSFKAKKPPGSWTSSDESQEFVTPPDSPWGKAPASPALLEPVPGEAPDLGAAYRPAQPPPQPVQPQPQRFVAAQPEPAPAAPRRPSPVKQPSPARAPSPVAEPAPEQLVPAAPPQPEPEPEPEVAIDSEINPGRLFRVPRVNIAEMSPGQYSDGAHPLPPPLPQPPATRGAS